MKLKHIVALRFMCLKDEIFKIDSQSAENIEFYGSIFRDYTAKSLNNMKNKSFDTVILVHPTNDLSKQGILLPIAADLGATIVKYDEFSDFCERYRGDGNLIVSRCDADDLYANYVIDDIQNSTELYEAPYIFGYGSSLLYRIGTDSLRLYDITYRNRGTFSCFQTLVYGKNCDAFKNVTPYAWNHTRIREKFQKLGYSDDQITSMIHFGYEKNFPFIWMRNGKNGSHDGLEQDLRYPEFHGISREQIKEQFGVDLPVS